MTTNNDSTDVSADIEAVVEDTELPRRLKDEVYSTIEERGVGVDDADRIAKAVETRYLDTRVDPLDPVGTVSAQSIGEPGTQMTMNTFHYAGVAEIDVTQGLPRLIELVDARKTPDTPMMTVYLDDEYATTASAPTRSSGRSRRRASSRWVTSRRTSRTCSSRSTSTRTRCWSGGRRSTTRTPSPRRSPRPSNRISASRPGRPDAHRVRPREPSYRDLLQLVEELRDIVFKGIEEVSRVVIRKENTDTDEEFVLYTEGSASATRSPSRASTPPAPREQHPRGLPAARHRGRPRGLIDETMNTLREQGLDDVNIRHLMLVADIMTNDGTIESIGRHGISGSKDSVLARAAFEVTVNHLLDAAIHGEEDDLDGVIENVIVGKPIASAPATWTSAWVRSTMRVDSRTKHGDWSPSSRTRQPHRPGLRRR